MTGKSQFAQKCTCAPVHLWLCSDRGELVKPYGGCTNRCDYCAGLVAKENAEMLTEDARSGGRAPGIVVVLTTREATEDMAQFARPRQYVARAVRRRWPGADYAYLVEYTTGYGTHSGGHRRPHWNVLWKGVPPEAADELRRLIVPIWCSHVDAEPQAQYVGSLDSAGGFSTYVTEHFMKASQRPPKGWRGQRFCASRGYFGALTVTQARARARLRLGFKRSLWKQCQLGFRRGMLLCLALGNHATAVDTVWRLSNRHGARIAKSPYDSNPSLVPPSRRRIYREALHPLLA
jgi:hypothetical protein